jgi:predicted transcriptional regulator
MDRISIYVPQNKRDEKPLERIAKVAKRQDRSLNYVVIQAILEYVQREEKKVRR